MNGTEKQIEWATQILANLKSYQADCAAAAIEYIAAKPQHAAKYDVKKWDANFGVLWGLESAGNADFWITHFKQFSNVVPGNRDAVKSGGVHVLAYALLCGGVDVDALFS